MFFSNLASFAYCTVPFRSDGLVDLRQTSALCWLTTPDVTWWLQEYESVPFWRPNLWRHARTCSPQPAAHCGDRCGVSARMFPPPSVLLMITAKYQLFSDDVWHLSTHPLIDFLLFTHTTLSVHGSRPGYTWLYCRTRIINSWFWPIVYFVIAHIIKMLHSNNPQCNDVL